MWACLDPCSVSRITSYGLDSSRSHKSVCLVGYILLLKQIKTSLKARLFASPDLEYFCNEERRHDAGAMGRGARMGREGIGTGQREAPGTAAATER